MSDSTTAELEQSEVRLDTFDHTLIPHRRSRITTLLWYLTSWFFFQTAFPWPYSIKRALLKMFGATIGRAVSIRTNVYIYSPWNLSIGDYCWVGDGCQLLSVDKITLDSHVALAHEVYLAAGGHDIRSASMRPKNAPIKIKSGCWITSRTFIGPGVTLDKNCVVLPGAIVVSSFEAGQILAGNPAQSKGRRTIDMK